MFVGRAAPGRLARAIQPVSPCCSPASVPPTPARRSRLELLEREACTVARQREALERKCAVTRRNGCRLLPRADTPAFAGASPRPGQTGGASARQTCANVTHMPPLSLPLSRRRAAPGAPLPYQLPPLSLLHQTPGRP